MQKDTSDLTIIYLTASEHPTHWEQFHFLKLLDAVGEYPLIISSIKEMNWLVDFPPFNVQFIYQTEPRSHRNMYRQLLKACKLATTPYIAVAESDTLYSPEHFNFYRPPLDAVAY